MVRELVERIRQKDQRAMNQLYKMYIEELSSVCYRYVPSKNDAKDVLQNSLVKIFTAIPTIDYRSEESLRAWMIKVVVNEALSFLRGRKKLLFIEQDPVAIQISDDEEPQGELPDGYRTVVNLYVFEGYPHKKIAAMLGITESTSASQLYYAKRELAKRINELIDSKR